MAEDMTIGGITWHSSEEGGGPDVGVSVYLGGNQRLWIGEITSQLFDQSGRDHFNSDGGWFLVWYKPEPVLIAKCGDDLDAREFVEHLASLIYLSAQRREPVVRVKELEFYIPASDHEYFISDTSIARYRIFDRGINWISSRFSVHIDNTIYPVQCFDTLEAAKSAAQADYEVRIMAAIEITSSDVEAHRDYSEASRRDNSEPEPSTSEAHDGGSPGPSPLAVKPGSSDPASGRSQPSPDVSVDELEAFIGSLEPDSMAVARALLARYRIERLDRLASGRR